MEPALRRGDREGVGGGSRMLRLHAQLIRASAAARMNESLLQSPFQAQEAPFGCLLCLGAACASVLQDASFVERALQILLALRDLE